MPISNEFANQFEQLSAALPVWFDILIGIAGLWGVFLWLFGRRIIRPTVTMAGLAGGAILAGAIGRTMTDGNAVIVFVIVGAIVGALATWMLFRIWMALLLAATLAAIAPWAVIAWEGVTPPPDPTADLKSTARDIIEDGVEQLNGGADDEAEADGDLPSFLPRIFGNPDEAEADEPPDEQPGLARRLNDAAQAGWNNLKTWWHDDLSASARWLIVTAAAAMAISGLLIGLIFPNLGAAIVASLIGSGIVLSAVLRLGGKYLGDAADWLPGTPRGVLITVIAMTIAGALIQWTVLRPRADKG